MATPEGSPTTGGPSSCAMDGAEGGERRHGESSADGRWGTPSPCVESSRGTSRIMRSPDEKDGRGKRESDDDVHRAPQGDKRRREEQAADEGSGCHAGKRRLSGRRDLHPERKRGFSERGAGRVAACEEDRGRDQRAARF